MALEVIKEVYVLGTGFNLPCLVGLNDAISQTCG